MIARLVFSWTDRRTIEWPRHYGWRRLLVGVAVAAVVGLSSRWLLCAVVGRMDDVVVDLGKRKKRI